MLKSKHEAGMEHLLQVQLQAEAPGPGPWVLCVPFIQGLVSRAVLSGSAQKL